MKPCAAGAGRWRRALRSETPAPPGTRAHRSVPTGRRRRRPHRRVPATADRNRRGSGPWDGLAFIDFGNHRIVRRVLMLRFDGGGNKAARAARHRAPGALSSVIVLGRPWRLQSRRACSLRSSQECRSSPYPAFWCRRHAPGRPATSVSSVPECRSIVDRPVRQGARPSRTSAALAGNHQPARRY